MSGVARSLNFYPIGNEKAEDGIANIALGLGKYIVDGGQTLRFSPRHPHSILQMSTMDFALRETQTRFYALDLKNMAEAFSVDDAFNLVKLGLKDADAEGSFEIYCLYIRSGTIRLSVTVIIRAVVRSFLS